MAQRWTDSAIDTAVKVLKRSNAADWPVKVIAAVGKAVGFSTTVDALDRALARARKPSPFQLLRGVRPRPKLKWNDDNIERAKKILVQSETIPQAVESIAAAVGFSITTASLADAFKQRGMRSLDALLKPRTAHAAVHPVAAQARREDESRIRTEHRQLVEELREANARHAFLDTITSTKLPPHVPRREKTSGLRDTTAVVLASDWHVEEEVDPESIAGRNEYNLEIADKRIERFFNAIVWNVEHHRSSKHLAVRDLVLWLGGDLMSGYIHEELMEGNQLSPTETCLWLLPRLNGGIRMLQERLDLASIVVPCSYGNHGRTTPKRRVATGAQNSYEWLMYNNLARELAGEKRIRFEITKSAHQYVNVYDFKVHFHHGDEMNYQGGVGGIGIPFHKAMDAWNEDIRCDIHNVGHWHQLKTFGSGNVNGSLIGFNSYAKSIKARFEEPKQAFYLVDANRGQSMWSPLWVSEKPQRKAA